MVTRQNTDEDMGQQVIFQPFDNPKALTITAGILFVMGLSQDATFCLPVLVLLASGAAYLLHRKQKLKRRIKSARQERCGNPT